MKRLLSLILLVTAFLLMSVVANAQTPHITWTVQYYDNPYLLDPPAHETTVTEINNDWFFGSPHSSVPDDNFSARYGTDAFFTAGTYRFTVEADDLVRITVDFQNVVLDTFSGGQSNEPIIRDVALAGNHHIQIDYREVTGLARLKVKIENVNDIGKPAPGEAVVTVRVPVLNVRQQATTDSAILSKISFGQVYRVVGVNVDSSWWQIDVNGVIGWVYAPLVNISNTATVTTVTTPPTTVTGSTSPTGFNATTQANLRLRSTPAITNNTLLTIPSGTIVPILARNDSATWFKVNFNDTIGWVNYQFIVTEPPLVLDQIPVE